MDSECLSETFRDTIRKTAIWSVSLPFQRGPTRSCLGSLWDHPQNVHVPGGLYRGSLRLHSDKWHWGHLPEPQVSEHDRPRVQGVRQKAADPDRSIRFVHRTEGPRLLRRILRNALPATEATHGGHTRLLLGGNGELGAPYLQVSSSMKLGSAICNPSSCTEKEKCAYNFLTSR